MTTASLVALSLALLVMAAVPGPGVFAVTARALAQGFAPAAPLALGIVAGDLVWLCAALLGLAYVAGEFPGLFQAIKIAGGLYLVYLGIQLWRAGTAAAASLPRAGRRHGLAAFLGGLTTTLGNPKVMVFYVAPFPAFVDLRRLAPSDGAVVAAIAAAVPLAVLLAYAAAAARARRLFTSATALRRLNRGAGSLMAATGVVVATR